MTSGRPYKTAWSNQNTFAELEMMVQKNQLDGGCVAALQNRLVEVETVQQRFCEV